jgi:hypothetical protein
MRLTAISLCIVLAVGGCAAPQLQSGNEAGGTISVGFNMSAKQAYALAEAECKKYGKIYRSEGINELRSTLRYTCVER